MKKILFFTLVLPLLISGCSHTVKYGAYNPTNKDWLEIAGEKKDFENKQYDSCFKFNLKILPSSALKRINKEYACIDYCCWRSDGEEIIIDFNDGFEEELARYGRALKYTPGQVKFTVKYASLIDMTKVTTAPAGAVKQDGTLNLKYEEITNPQRLASVERDLRMRSSQKERQLTTAQKLARAQAVKDARESELLTAEYNRKTAVNLILRIYGKEIDSYLRKRDAARQTGGNIVTTGQKQWDIEERHEGVYFVNCKSQNYIGKTKNTMKPYSEPCGRWQSDIYEKEVFPLNATAEKIIE